MSSGAALSLARANVRAGWRRWSRRTGTTGAVVSGSVLAVLVAAAALAPLLASYPVNQISLLDRLQAPASSHLLGTDSLGRDLFTQMVYGARISLLVGAVSVLIGATVGITVGILAGYFGGRFDNVVMRVADIQMAFPFVLLAIALMAVLGAGVSNLILVLALRSWVDFARLIRGEVLRVKPLDYIESAIAVGASHLRVVTRHLLPNVMTPAIVLISFSVAQAIIVESSLSFLGFGPGPDVPTWGGILAGGRSYLTSAWWIALFPGVALMLTVLSINVLGDWLRDRLDPRLREERWR